MLKGDFTLFFHLFQDEHYPDIVVIGCNIHYIYKQSLNLDAVIKKNYKEDLINLEKVSINVNA